MRIWHHKNRVRYQARHQSTLHGQYSKGYWVAQAIAGGGLYVKHNNNSNYIMKNNHLKKICIISLLIIASFFLSQNVFAISGACSHHGGVNCVMGRQLNGKVYCNDGWTDSIADYDFMVACKNYKFSCNSKEWQDLSLKYDLDNLFFKLQTATEQGNLLLYDALKIQYDTGFNMAERECEAIGTDRAFEQNYERMEFNFYDNQMKAEQEKLAQLEQERQKLTENYLDSLNNLNTYPQNIPQYNCPVNSTLNGTTCICNEGYTSNGTACITYTQNCQVHFGINSYGDKQNCYCSSGYEFNNDQSLCVASITCPLNSTKIGQSCVCNDDFILKNEQCITYTQDCINNFGLNVYGIKGDNGNSSCYCKDGYEWNASQTACIKSVICPLNFKKVNNECVCDNNYIKKNNNCITPTEDCVDKYGSYIYGIISASKNDSSCFCLEGYEWNTSKTACVKKTEEKQIIKKASQTQTQQEQPQKNKPEDKKELVENIEIEKQAVNEFQEQPKEHSEKQKPQENQQAEQKKEQEKGHSMFSAGIFDAIRSVFRMFLSWF